MIGNSVNSCTWRFAPAVTVDMEAREKQIAPPKSWETFEDLCLELFKAIWSDPLAQKNGRRGQPQHGVDVFGSKDGLSTAYLGIQCKGKDQGVGAQATVCELEDELTKADKFEPPLAHWVFVTTAPTDVALQEAARRLSVERTQTGLFPVTVLGWGDLQALLIKHTGVLERFYPEVAFDLAGLMTELRRSASERTADELQRSVADSAVRSEQNAGTEKSWRPVQFEEGRDLGPALMGRPLGPADVSACPILPEARIVAAALEQAFSVRLEGRPGVGKSVCALQAAKIFADRGRRIVKLADPRVNHIDWLPPAEEPTLYVIDDAHLTPDYVLKAAEAETNPTRMLLSTHNAVGQGSGGRGAVVLDAKRAVGVIAAKLRADRVATLAVVRRADDTVGDRSHEESLDHRLDHAEKQADRPWQFCFILGGGWRRAMAAADAARATGADLTLAAVAIYQLASRDSRPKRDALHAMLAAAGVPAMTADAALNWLIDERLVVGPSDLRTPHQRFATVVLGCILAGQDRPQREMVGELLNIALEDSSHPLAGLRLLLDELPRLGFPYSWTHLVQPARLTRLIGRCWEAESTTDRMFAMLVLAELDGYVPGWPRSVLDGRYDLLAKWFSDPEDPSGYGIGRLTNSVRGKEAALSNALVGASDPERVAEAVSKATAKTAYNLAEMLALTGSTRPDDWKVRFHKALDRKALVELGRRWPLAESIFVFAKLCHALCWTDETLALDMVEAFTPMAQRALADDPVGTFHELNDIAWHVLRVLDPIGAYRGKHRPSKRGRRLAAGLCVTLKPAVLSKQLSATGKRDFQQAAYLLSFLMKAAPRKFNQVVAGIDWDQVSAIYGEDWSNLDHDAEVFLGVCFQRAEHRAAITALIERNAHCIKVLSPRIALMAPDVAYRHVAEGRVLGLAYSEHVSWRPGAGVLGHFIENRPDLVDTLLRMAEPVMAKVLSQQHHSWYEESALLLRMLRQFAPQSLARILGQLDVAKAEIGWAASLAKGGGPRRSAALLVDAAQDRTDPVGDMGRRIRGRFPKFSIPKPEDVARFE
jgi:hypothetical protein